MTHSLDLVDRRGVDRENLLHTDAIGHAANRDSLLDAAVLLGDDDALEDLNTLTRAFLDLHVDADGIADFHLGHLFELLFVQCFDQIHG